MNKQNEIKPSTWMTYLAKVITISTICFSIIGIIGYSFDLYRHGSQKHFIGWFSSAGFVLLTIPISIRLIVMHLTHWNAPSIQKYVVRIIWMIPIYSIESWFALRFKSLALYIETLRECYEAYAIFSFLYFLFALLGDEQQIITKLKLKSDDYGKHPWPISLIVSPWIMGQEVFNKCKLGVLQYVLIKNITSIIVCILASYGYYHEGNFRFDQLYLYQCVICNISQLWALYCMILFYFATKEELAPWRPVGKFLCVKMVVFFTWWQSVVVNFICFWQRKAINYDEEHWTVNEVSKGVQDYIICIEMFFAAIAFSYTFTHKDYATYKDKDYKSIEESKPFLTAFLQSALPDDIFHDIGFLAKTQGFTRKTSNEHTSNQSMSSGGDTNNSNNNNDDDDDEESHLMNNHNENNMNSPIGYDQDVIIDNDLENVDLNRNNNNHNSLINNKSNNSSNMIIGSNKHSNSKTEGAKRSNQQEVNIELVSKTLSSDNDIGFG